MTPSSSPLADDGRRRARAAHLRVGAHAQRLDTRGGTQGGRGTLVRDEHELRGGHLRADAGEDVEQEAQVLIPVEVAGVADERRARRGLPVDPARDLLGHARGRDTGEVGRGHARLPQPGPELLGDRDAEVGPPGHRAVEKPAHAAHRRAQHGGVRVGRELLGERTVPVVHERTAARAGDHETRERRLVVVRVDHVHGRAADAAPEAKRERGVEQEPRGMQAGSSGETAAVGDHEHLVPARAQPVGELAHQHLRSAQRRVRTGDGESDAHQR